MATRERSFHQVEDNAHVHNDENRHIYYRNPFDNIYLGGNDENKAPLRSHRLNIRIFSLTPRHSQSHQKSEINDKITSKDPMRFQQDKVTQRLMLKALE